MFVLKALTRRIGLIKKSHLPDVLGGAGITAVLPLCIGTENVGFQYGIIFAPTLNKLVIGKGQFRWTTSTLG